MSIEGPFGEETVESKERREEEGTTITQFLSLSHSQWHFENGEETTRFSLRHSFHTLNHYILGSELLISQDWTANQTRELKIKRQNNIKNSYILSDRMENVSKRAA